MLDGIWPGRDDTMAVQRYVTMHFSDDWNTYLYFAQWGDSQIAANPKTIVRREDWLLVAEEDGGGRIKGEGILQSPRPLTETNDGAMIGLSPTQKLSTLHQRCWGYISLLPETLLFMLRIWYRKVSTGWTV